MPTPFDTPLKLPLVAAPMFLISGPELVIECCKNGIVGTFPALNQRTSQGFEEWLIQIKSELRTFEETTGKQAAPFGVNLIVHGTNPRVQADLALCVKHEVPLIITSLGAVPELVGAVQRYGGKVFHDVIKIRHAQKAVEAGVDGLICVSAGAGGHAGTLNPIPFIQEVRSFFDGTILLSGCLSNGQDIATALQMGADLAYMGTRFINTTESNAMADYRQMIIDSGTTDVVYTAAISGVHGSFLRQSLENNGITEEMWGKTKRIDFGEELDASEAKAWQTVWSAGQGVATIADVAPVADLIATMHAEFVAAIEAQTARLEHYRE